MHRTIQEYLSEKKDQYNRIEKELTHTMLTTDYRGDNLAVYNSQSNHYTTCIESQSVKISELKNYIENLIEVGYELGLYGMLLLAKELRRKLKLSNIHSSIIDSSSRKVFDDIFQHLECLVDDILKILYQLNIDNHQILFSPKVFKLLDRILKQQHQRDAHRQAIVFVERISTAHILREVLSFRASSLEPPQNNRLIIEYVTGTRPIPGDKPMTAKYQVRSEFPIHRQI